MRKIIDAISEVCREIENVFRFEHSEKVALLRAYGQLQRLIDQVAKLADEIKTPAPQAKIPEGYFCVSLNSSPQTDGPREVYCINGFFTDSFILAIKRVRQDRLDAGMDHGLKEAKEFVDSLKFSCRAADGRCLDCGQKACKCGKSAW